MESRRNFLKAGAAAAVVSRTVLGANDRVQMGIIGLGTRGNQVYQSFMRHSDVTFVAACDVQKNRMDQFISKAGGKMKAYGDYRRLIEDKDVEAVLITTPDHWHCPMLVDACEAGKDAYVEKPVSNTIEAALKMVEVTRRTKRIVQVGVQQRSWQHFQDWAKRVREQQYIGNINHCVLLFGGGGGGFAQPPEQPQAPPPDLDWEMFQGPAPRKPFVPSRLRWRSWWDYGGGSITDWGVHLTDVMCWYMNADEKAPLITSAVGYYSNPNDDPAERAPDTFSVVWRYDKFVATFTNAVPPSGAAGMSEMYGNWFYGQKGVLLVNRYGYELRPVVRAMPGRGGEAAPPPALKPEREMDPQGMSENPDSKFGSATVRHCRNFLDCVKSRQRPAADMEIGFNSTLPTLLAVLSIRHGKAFTWNGHSAVPA